MDNAEKLWQIVKSKLETIYPGQFFEDTFKKIEKVYRIHNNYIYLIVSNQLIKYKIEKFYLNQMNQILCENTEEKMGFKLILEEEIKAEEEKKSSIGLTVADKVPTVNVRKLKPEYTFNNFVTGEANREAFTFALQVAGSPHVTSNPLYLFGDVGLGKTHLMMSIGHYVLDNNINANVVYTKAQQFVEDYINSKSKNQKSTEAANQFNEYYRNADLLLVDDVQFLAGKTGSQEEFFKLFEILFENNKQIVITSDRPASELDIMSRLKTRFAWGLPVDIRKPNFELRKAILKKKLQFLIEDPEKVEDEALSYIAESFTESIRDLEGALRKFVFTCVAFNYDFTLENAISALGALNKEKVNDQKGNNVEIDRIKNVVANYFNITTKDLVSTSRKQNLVYARDIFVYIVKTNYSFPQETIGVFLGGKDHSTIAHSYNKIENGIKSDQNIKQDIININKKLEKLKEN